MFDLKKWGIPFYSASLIILPIAIILLQYMHNDTA